MRDKMKNIEAVNELAGEIASLSDGVKKLLSGKLNERCLITLIYDAMPNSMRGGKLCNRGQIKEVLCAASSLKELYIKKSKSAEMEERG